jgi:uncharacterized protein YjiS (DUF1127 family)
VAKVSATQAAAPARVASTSRQHQQGRSALERQDDQRIEDWGLFLRQQELKRQGD